MANHSKLLMVAVAVTTVVVGTIALWALTGSSTKKASAKQSSTKALETGSLSKQLLVDILKQIIFEMGGVIREVGEIEKNIREQCQKSGEQLSQEQLSSFLIGQFEHFMKQVEGKVYLNYGCTEEKVQEAAEFYKDDPEVQELISQMTNSLSLFGLVPPSNIQVPDSLTVDKVAEVVQKSMNVQAEVLEEVLAEIAPTVPPGTNPAEAPGFETLFHERMTAGADKVYQESGYTAEEIQGALMKFKDDPTLARQLMEMQESVANRLNTAIEKYKNTSS